MVGHTRLINDDDLADVDHVALTAHQVQYYVNKLTGVRVVAVGDQIFPVAIHPLSEAARIDFRADYCALRQEVIELPVPVTQGVRRFMSESGLLMASMDFSVGHDGRYYFLEPNPAGGQTKADSPHGTMRSWACASTTTGQVRNGSLNSLWTENARP
jgi:hypothetical protein